MMAQVKKTFAMADTNHDGFMSRAEFAARMGAVVNREAPPTKEDAQRMLDAANRAFNDVDTNHDGKLSLAEAMKRPLKAFDMMDTNHDGILTVAEKAAAHQNAPALPNGPTQGEMQGPGR
jgi:Ca2+-binding EF-hand superfamily protein